MDKPRKDAIRTTNPVMSKSVIARLKAQTGEDFTELGADLGNFEEWTLRDKTKITEPIIDIYLPARKIRKHSHFVHTSLDDTVGYERTDCTELSHASANHAAKQIIDRMNMRDVGGVYPEWALSDKDYQALKNLVKEK
jgi:hypothetical protein